MNKKSYTPKMLVFVGGALIGLQLYASSSNGYLFSGQNIDLTPKDGYALSIIRNGSFKESDTFDLVMSNKGEIFYNAPEQSDDIYLVFHDDVKPGDRIHIHVNKGTFYYKFKSLKALPKLVKSALSSEVLNKKPKKRVKKRVSTKRREIKKQKNQTQITKQVVTTSTQTLQVAKDIQSPISKPLFEKFTKIFEELFGGKKERITQTKKVTRQKIEKKELIKPKKVTKPKIKKVLKPKKKIEDILKEFDARELEHEAAIMQNSFYDLPKEFVKPKKKSAPKKVVKKPTPPKPKKKIVQEKKPVTVPKDTTLFNAHEELKQNANSLPKVQEPKQPKKEVTISKPVVPIVPIEVPAIEAKPIKEQRVVITDATEAKVSNEDKFAGRVLGPTVKAEPTREYIDDSYKSNKSISTKSNTKVKSDGDKIVITKIIKQQEQEDKFEGRVLGKTSDRVLGNGYNPNAATGKMSVRATRNDMPVSAWVEVFKNDTKHRVKTFYTSTNKLKSVRLPAGTYMIRATYRTRDNKIQTTIKNIRLKKGKKLNKLIAFHDGVVAIKATRGGAPLYVKVEAYKSGSNERVAFDFSSRTTGLAKLTLNEGTYDIRVYDHKNVRKFDGIQITGGSTKPIDVSF